MERGARDDSPISLCSGRTLDERVSQMAKDTKALWTFSTPKPAGSKADDHSIADQLVKIGSFCYETAMNIERRQEPKRTADDLMHIVAAANDVLWGLDDTYRLDLPALFKQLLSSLYKGSENAMDYLCEPEVM